MFGVSTGMLTRPLDNPQRYRPDADFRSSSQDSVSHSCPAQQRLHHLHTHHPHHGAQPHASAPTPAARPSEATTAAPTSAHNAAVMPLRQREVVHPTRRAPRHPPPPLSASRPLQQPNASAEVDVNNTAVQHSPAAPSVPSARGLATAHPPETLHGSHEDPPYVRRARSSEIRRSGLAAPVEERDTRQGTASSPHVRSHRHGGTNSSTATFGNNTPTTTQGSARVAEVLATGLRGFQTYMGMMFQSSHRGGMNVHPTPYEADSSNSAYRVPESPVPLVHRTRSDIVTGRERSRRVRAQVTGIPIKDQHALLRRLRFVRSAFGHETDSAVSGPPSLCNLSSPLSVLTPLSTFAPREDEGMTLERWIDSLQAADSAQVPFPAVSQACSVCLRGFYNEEDVAELPCGHLYHFSCILRWLTRQGSCPCCRADVRELGDRTTPEEEEEEVEGLG